MSTLSLYIPVVLLFSTFMPTKGFVFSYSQMSCNSDRHQRRMVSSPLCMSSNFNNDMMSGLTDDGDFAILGVNALEQTEEDDNNSSSINNINTGTSIGFEGVGSMLFNEELIKSGRVDIGVGSSNTYKDFRGNEIIPKIDPAVKQWLVYVLPSLDENDVERYAEGLTSIGFHPECPSLCEIRYEDLSFISKVLHRRYLFKEITGEEHPFEP